MNFRPRFLHLAMGREREERKRKKRRREMTNHKRRSLARLDDHAAGGEKAAFAFPPRTNPCFVSSLSFLPASSSSSFSVPCPCVVLCGL